MKRRTLLIIFVLILTFTTGNLTSFADHGYFTKNYRSIWYYNSKIGETWKVATPVLQAYGDYNAAIYPNQTQAVMCYAVTLERLAAPSRKAGTSTFTPVHMANKLVVQVDQDSYDFPSMFRALEVPAVYGESSVSLNGEYVQKALDLIISSLPSIGWFSTVATEGLKVVTSVPKPSINYKTATVDFTNTSGRRIGMDFDIKTYSNPQPGRHRASITATGKVGVVETYPPTSYWDKGVTTHHVSNYSLTVFTYCDFYYR